MYSYSQTQKGLKFCDLTEAEQAYLRREWDARCTRENENTPELVFIQKPQGLFFEAKRARVACSRYEGCAGGYWSIRVGNCRRWYFQKSPLGGLVPEPTEHCFRGSVLVAGESVTIPKTVHTKKDVLALAAKLNFQI